MTPPRPEVDAILRPLLPHLGAALRGGPQGAELAVVVVAEGRDPAPSIEALAAVATFREVRGHWLAAAPLERVRALAEEQTFDLAAELAGELEPGQTWYLLLGPGGRASAGAITWSKTSPTGRRARDAS